MQEEPQWDSAAAGTVGFHYLVEVLYPFKDSLELEEFCEAGTHYMFSVIWFAGTCNVGADGSFE